ncbi:hypothetical protein [Paracidovorax konjaci]|uniref:Uncharacterized protein n=1 Tax=Paracidovorax konjaci TaxID=32040 RepID=A0A1I1YIB3_9BURK|nr:hypothetical protein [Paracidovorax konjaci]SFE19119.1 hypothetical protein SAMN04489710_11822 [Paracidovorax konjaci]
MKFRSPSDEPIHVGLLTGHTALITPEGVELPAIFHKEASARGAIAFDEGPASTVGESTVDRQAAIAAVIKAMLDGSDPEDFTADGKPNLTKVKARAGFTVTREEADAAFLAAVPAK